MFTLNFNKIVSGCASGAIYDLYRSGGGTCECGKFSTYLRPLYLSTSSNTINTALISTTTNMQKSAKSTGYMVLGTDGTAESYEDYTVTADTSLTMKSYSCDLSQDDDAGTATVTMSKTVSNSTSGDVEIKEVGIFGCANATYQTNYECVYQDILMYRKVFDEPVVIGQNQTVKFTLTFTIGRDLTVETGVSEEQEE